jgi:NADPH:quinone reductase
MVRAIRIHKPGGPEALSFEEVEVGPPGTGQIRLKQTAIGLNYIDVYHRTGLYPIAQLPAVIGMEAAGLVEAVGPGVDALRPGDRVAYGGGPLGAYAEARVIDAGKVVKLPDAIDDRTAAAIMLKGMTAHYLLRRVYVVKPGDTILVQAAAGGVGLILCQWAKSLGATVIGTVGSKEKAAEARAHGCDHPILYREEDFAARVRELTKGEGVPVVYDSVGKDTFMKSLDCLRPFGVLALFGQSSGPVPPVDLAILAQKGSLYVTRPTLMTYVAKRPDLDWAARELFEVVGSGKVKIKINQTYPLADAARAHRDLEERKTTGSTLLLPQSE